MWFPQRFSQGYPWSRKGSRKNNLIKCHVILREPRRLKNPLGVPEILRSLRLPQDDMDRLELLKLFFRGSSVFEHQLFVARVVLVDGLLEGGRAGDCVAFRNE